jgi:hypothetical protein
VECKRPGILLLHILLCGGQFLVFLVALKYMYCAGGGSFVACGYLDSIATFLPKKLCGLCELKILTKNGQNLPKKILLIVSFYIQAQNNFKFQ